MFLKNRTAATLVYPTNPLGIELYYRANVFLCFRGKTDLVSESTLFLSREDLKVLPFATNAVLSPQLFLRPRVLVQPGF